jgi:MFS family permease
VAVTTVAARESRDPASGTRLDVPGLTTLSAGMTAIVLALIEGRDWGWTSPETLGLAAAGAILIAAFWLIEHRVSNPIVEFALFRNGPYFGATAAAFTLVGAYWSLMFFEPQYLQDVLGYGPVEAGLLILPITVPMIAISPFAGALIARVGPRLLMTVGLACAAVGLVLLSRIDSGSGYADLLPGFTLFGIALGLVYAPMSSAAMAAMPRTKAGIAAGVLAMNRVLAGAVALAATGAVFGSLESDGETFTYSLAHALWILVGLTVVGTALTWAFVRAPEEKGPDPAVAGDPPPDELRHHAHHRRFHL